jgi:hypothetical protein
MKIALLVTLLAISASAEGQTTAASASNETPSMAEVIQADRARAKTVEENEAPSIRASIQADRAKAKADEESASKDRPWDRGASALSVSK